MSSCQISLSCICNKIKEDPCGFIQWGLPPIMVVINLVNDIRYINKEKEALQAQNYYGLYILSCLLIPFLVWVFVFYTCLCSELYFGKNTEQNQQQKKLQKQEVKQETNCCCYCCCCLFQILVLFLFCILISIPLTILCLLKIFFWSHFYKISFKSVCCLQDLENITDPEIYAEFYTNFQFIKQGICLYIQTMTIKFVGQWTGFTTFTIIFKILLLSVNIISMAKFFTQRMQMKKALKIKDTKKQPELEGPNQIQQ